MAPLVGLCEMEKEVVVNRSDFFDFRGVLPAFCFDAGDNREETGLFSRASSERPGAVEETDANSESRSEEGYFSRETRTSLAYCNPQALQSVLPKGPRRHSGVDLVKQE